MSPSRWLIAPIVAAVALAAAPAGAGAQATSKPAEQCFLSDNVNGFSAPNDRTVYVQVGVNDVYRLDLMSDCQGLTFRQGIGLKGAPASPWICSPLDAEIVYRDAGIKQRCPVTAIHKLTPAELAALPKRDRP